MRCLWWIFVLLSSWDLAVSVLLPVRKTPKPPITVAMPSISSSQYTSAFQNARKIAENKATLEASLPNKGCIIPAGSLSAKARHQKFNQIQKQSLEIERSEDMMEQASLSLMNSLKLNDDQAAYGLPKLQLQGVEAQREVTLCKSKFSFSSCADSEYRTQDGSCNNFNNPLWGKAFTCHDRILPPVYADGISAPRQARSGRPLPNPRVISQTIHTDVSANSNTFSHITMAFGQFTDHDLTLTPMSRVGDDLAMMDCCPKNQNNHPECLPIDIPRDDRFFSQFGETCMNFIRSASCTDCGLGPRQQTNQLTAWIDGSQIYGSSLNETNALREFRGGLLKSQSSRSGLELLPSSRSPHNDQCSQQTAGNLCFQAGDGRVNEQPTLTSMHTIWLRQHNRIVKELQRLNPRWSDERLFQETRKIVGAQFQMVVYSQFLPVVLGRDYMTQHDLWPQNSGFTRYDPRVSGKTFHEFITAAFRFGHTIIRNEFPTIAGNGAKSSINLKDNYFFPFDLYNGALDSLLRGLYTTPAQQFDNFIVEAVTNHLYKERGAPFGMDLPALNLQRGRDHGIPGYTAYLDYFFNIRINSFQDLTKMIPGPVVQKLSTLYENVHDVDLFTGGVSEFPISVDSVVGPTFGNIIGMQFFHLKFGDRYFFEHGGQLGSFSSAQLAQIRTTTLGRIVCANADAISNNIRPNLFTTEGPNNFPTYCGNLPEMDLHYWIK